MTTSQGIKIINKFFQRALWMNDPNSPEFKMFFLEMVTEIRQLSGREFNADVTVEDLKRTLYTITEKYPLSKHVTLNTVFKTLDTMQTFGKIGDLFSIALAVSMPLISLTLAFTGPGLYLFFKIFAPERLKCGAIFTIGGLIAMELYDIREDHSYSSLPNSRQKNLALPALLGVLGVALSGFVLALSQSVLPLQVLSGIGILVGSGITSSAMVKILLLRSQEKKHQLLMENRTFNFRTNSPSDPFSQFKLDREEARFLLSLENSLTEDNIEKTHDTKFNSEKRIWIDQWKNAVERELGEKLVTNRAQIEDTLLGPIHTLPKLKLGLLFAECVLFHPYFPLDNHTKLSIHYKEGNLSLKDLEELGKKMNLNQSPKALLATFQNAKNSIGAQNLIQNLVQGFMQGGMNNPMGITVLQEKTGLLATSTMLSLSRSKLPKDAVEHLRENNYIICGGITIGEGAENLMVQLAAIDSSFTLTQLAKLETVIQKIIAELPEAFTTLRYIISRQAAIRDEMVRSYNQKRGDRDELKKSISFYEVAIRRNEEFVQKIRKNTP